MEGMPTDDHFVGLFYTLMRDGDVSPGRMAELLKTEEATARKTLLLTNQHLGAYAAECVQRLRDVNDKAAHEFGERRSL